jgi:hypothetical protein
MIGWSHGYGLGTETPHTGSRCSDRGCIGFSRNQHRLSLKSTHRLRPPISEWHEVFCRGRTRCTVHKMHGALLEVKWVHTQVVEGRMVEEPPSTANFSSFNYMCPGRHLSLWGCMFPIFHMFPLQEIRIKQIQIFPMDFWNNIKILFPRT